MSQGFTNNLTTIPIPVSQGGNGVTRIPSCSANQSGSTTLATAAFTKIALDTTVYDIGSYFDASNKRYTPGVAGLYLVTWSIYITNAQLLTQYFSAAYKNGTIHRAGTLGEVTLAGDMIMSGSGIVSMNGTTDYIEIFGYNGHATLTAATSTLVSHTRAEFTWLGPSS